MDPFAQRLKDLVAHLERAWAASEETMSPLGELAAEAGAVLQFYLEQGARPSPEVSGRAIEWAPHWSVEWEREHYGRHDV